MSRKPLRDLGRQQFRARLNLLIDRQNNDNIEEELNNPEVIHNDNIEHVINHNANIGAVNENPLEDELFVPAPPIR